MERSVRASESPIYFMFHLHNQGGVKWLYSKNDLGLPFTEFNKRSAVFFSHSAFLPCYTPFCLFCVIIQVTLRCRAGAAPELRSREDTCQAHALQWGLRRRQLRQVPKLAVKNHVQPGCTLVVGSHDRWLLICLFLHQLSGQPVCKGRSPISLHSSCPRRI